MWDHLAGPIGTINSISFFIYIYIQALILGVGLLKRKENKKYIKFRPFNKKLISNFNANFKKDFLLVDINKRLNNFLRCHNEVQFFTDNFDFDSFLSNHDISYVQIESMFE